MTEKIWDELAIFNRQREDLKKHADEIMIYEFCKIASELALFADVPFAELSFDEKVTELREMIPFVDEKILKEGAQTFHENCDHYKYENQ